jgi:ABC-type multidrug transport system ATPase subunit
VRNNLEFWGRLAFIDGKRLKGEIDRTIARFALEELSSRRVDRLSMGQRQRVRLAMAFLHSPRLVLLDEPRTSLDSDGTALLTEALREHRAQGGAAIWCAPTGDSDPLDFDSHYVVDHGRLTSS